MAVLVFSVCGCDEKPQPRGPAYATAPATQEIQTYSFAVHPLHNPSKMHAAYQPLIDYLNRTLREVTLVLEPSRDYGHFEDKLRAHKPAFLLPNPWQTLQAMHAGYSVFAMAGESTDFRGILLVRCDSGIAEPIDLKGRAVSYPSPTALAACIMPQFFLHSRGVDVNKDIENLYVGSQESAIMNAYLGRTAAAATWPPPWRAFQKEHPKEAGDLKVMWETPPLVNNSIMARSDVPVLVRTKVLDCLLMLHEKPEGRAILGGMETARFLPATDADYDLVRDYIARFEREVRAVDRR